MLCDPWRVQPTCPITRLRFDVTSSRHSLADQYQNRLQFSRRNIVLCRLSESIRWFREDFRYIWSIHVVIRTDVRNRIYEMARTKSSTIRLPTITPTLLQKSSKSHFCPYLHRHVNC